MKLVYELNYYYICVSMEQLEPKQSSLHLDELHMLLFLFFGTN